MYQHGVATGSMEDAAPLGIFDPTLEYYAQNYLGTNLLRLIGALLGLLGICLFLLGGFVGYGVAVCWGISSSKPRGTWEQNRSASAENPPEPEREPTARAPEVPPAVDPEQAGRGQPSAPPPPETEPTSECFWGQFQGEQCKIPAVFWKSEGGDHVHLRKKCPSGFRKTMDHDRIKACKVCLHCMRSHGFRRVESDPRA